MTAPERCPVCGEPADPDLRHWCSDGCRYRDEAATIDLIDVLTAIALEAMGTAAADPAAA